MEHKYGYEEVYLDNFAAFQCQGASCRLSCCSSDWDVELDEEAVQAARGLAQGTPWEARLAQAMGEPEEDGRVTLRFCEGKCLLWDADGLCGWQKAFGEEAMWETCRNYPREAVRVKRRVERSVALSCPAVVEGLLNREAPLYICRMSEAKRKEEFYVSDFSPAMQTGPLQEIYVPMRERVLSILQQRQYPFQERLLRLGVYGMYVRSLVEKGRWKEAGGFVRSFGHYGQETVRKLILPCLSDQEKAFQARKKLWKRLTKKLLCWEETPLFAGARQLLKSEEPALAKTGLQRLEDYFQAKPFLREHLAVSLCFAQGTPFLFGYGIVPDRTGTMLALWAALEFLWQGACVEQPMDDGRFAAITAGFLREVLHSDDWGALLEPYNDRFLDLFYIRKEAQSWVIAN